MKYSEFTTQKRKKKLLKNFVWFNPSFSKNVSKNFTKKFLSLINKHFSKSPHLKKIGNKNYVKVSYNCTENIYTFMQRHNAKIKSQENNATSTFNCWKKDVCPLNGECQTTSVIYKCTVIRTRGSDKKLYIGLTEKEFKTSLWKQSMNNKKYRNNTSLFWHVLKIKEKHCFTPMLTLLYFKLYFKFQKLLSFSSRKNLRIKRE